MIILFPRTIVRRLGHCSEACIREIYRGPESPAAVPKGPAAKSESIPAWEIILTENKAGAGGGEREGIKKKSWTEIIRGTRGRCRGRPQNLVGFLIKKVSSEANPGGGGGGGIKFREVFILQGCSYAG